MPLLKAEGLVVRFGGLTAVDQASIELEAGQIHGLIGPNGAGKTTFFNAITGLERTHAGSLTFDQRPIEALSAHERARLGMRRTFQAIQLSPKLTVLENVMLGVQSTLKDPWWRVVFNTNVRKAEDWGAQERVYEILDRLGLTAVALQPGGSLTFQQQRMVELARALVSRPRILLLDEPAAGLSPDEIEELDRTLMAIRKETGVAILLVEHVISLVMNVCDHVTVLERGKVISTGSPAQISSDPRVRQAYLGDEHAATR